MSSGGVPVDWYRTSFSPNYEALFFERGGEQKAALALQILKAEGYERILDLACATGRRTLELSRRGYNVVGVDLHGCLLEVAACEAKQEGLWPHFVEEDPRDLEFEEEFDFVLSLGGGAFGHYDYDEEDMRAFRAAARAVRRGGRLLMQVPNVLHAEAHLPERTWICEGEITELVSQHWNEGTRRLDGTTQFLVAPESPEDSDPEPFQRRLYTVEELADILGEVGLRFADVFDEHGERCVPTAAQKELFVEARNY
jgi:SAM-dependent methyltransferase